MKNNRLVCALAAVTVIAALCAGLVFKVSLAKPVEADATGDKLIGVFVTEDYVDTFDIDSFAHENADKLVNGNVTLSLEDSLKYQSRIYAVKSEKTSTGEDGSEVKSPVYDFEGIDGLKCLFLTEMQSRTVSDYSGEFIDNDYPCHTLDSDMECSSVFSHNVDESAAGADTNETELNCYVYAFADSSKEFIGMYCNPVYQDSEGNVYLTSGQCILTGGDAGSEGLTLTNTINESYTETSVTGKTVSEKMSIAVTLQIVSAPVNFLFTQYDSSGMAIDSQNFAPENMPDEYRINVGCEYIVVTETDKDGQIKRSLIDKEASDYTYYVASGKSYANSRKCELIWP